MNILIACEFSGVVRDAFIRHGHKAVSCDLLETETPGPHIVGDVFDHLDDGWDMMIFFWPCTNMAVSGARWFREKRDAQARDVVAFTRLATYPHIPRIAGENPIGVLSTKFRKPDQIIQPWQFGHPQTKATCLWLKRLPKLVPTKIITYPQRDEFLAVLDYEQAIKQWHAVHQTPPGPDRWRIRSRTFPGIGDAMADQWGSL